MKLSTDELLLLDWVFSTQGAKASGETLDDLMRWRTLRERVWRALLLGRLSANDKGSPEPPIDLDGFEEELLALLPTTFRWGPGEDCGITLKFKLAAELWETEERERFGALQRMRAMIKEDVDAGSSSDLPNKDNPANTAVD